MLLAGGALLRLGERNLSTADGHAWRGWLRCAHGLAQSLFQVGGNVGHAFVPVLAAFLILPRGQSSLTWFTLVSACWNGSAGSTGTLVQKRRTRAAAGMKIIRWSCHVAKLRQVRCAIAVLIALICSKFFYSQEHHQLLRFFLYAPVQISTVDVADLSFHLHRSGRGGCVSSAEPAAEWFGRRKVIWGSILGVLPFTLALLGSVGLTTKIVLRVTLIGLVSDVGIHSDTCSVEELMPGRVGMVSVLFFEHAFGMGGVGAAVLGVLADWTSIEFVYHVCFFLSTIGFFSIFLPNVDGGRPGTEFRAFASIPRLSRGNSA